MSFVTNEILRDWYELYSSLNKSEINVRISEIKNSTEKVHQEIYQLRALEMLMLKEPQTI